jgi:hypothetical protein
MRRDSHHIGEEYDDIAARRASAFPATGRFHLNVKMPIMET